MGKEVGGVSGWGTHIHSWLLNVIVWQKPPQYCKVISLQLNKLILKILFSVVVPAIFSCPLISLITYTSLHAPAQSLSHAQLFKTLWTVAHQAPLSMDSPR